jgi:hypothetical protein
MGQADRANCGLGLPHSAFRISGGPWPNSSAKYTLRTEVGGARSRAPEPRSGNC